MRRWSAALTLSCTLPALAACVGPLGGQSCEDAANQPVEAAAPPEVQQRPESSANLVLDVSSSSDEEVRLTVRLDGRVALDATLPGTPSVCAHPPVYSYSFDLPGAPVRVTAVTDRGQRSSTTLELGAQKRWVVVQIQDGFPLHVEPWETEPHWG